MPGQRAAKSAHPDFVGSRVYAYLGVTCHLQFRQNERVFFTCYCGNTGVERTLNKSQHTNLTLEKKILPPLLPGFELAKVDFNTLSTAHDYLRTAKLD